MDYTRKSAAKKFNQDYNNTANERVIYNLSKAESLLDEPDGAFNFGGDMFGRPQTGNYPAGSRIGATYAGN
jgi:hypothetical protein